MVLLLGYRDRNVHELVCHEVAERAGDYRRFGVEVEAVLGYDHPNAAISAGLGGSLVETLRGQRRWRAAMVHTLHPMFWMWARAADPAETGPTVLAGHPEGSIVWAFTQQVLAAHHMSAGELTVLRFPVGIDGDHLRLEALTSGAVDAAVLGSTFAPNSLARRGLTASSYFGEALRFPTVGVAVDADRTDIDDHSVQALIGAQRAAIMKIKQEHPVALDAVMSLLHECSRDDALHMLREYIAPQYGPGHQDIQGVGSSARAWLTAQLGSVTESGADFYEGVR